MQRMKIFALPYAAGSAGIYYNMRKYLNNTANMIPVELPGHGSRYIQPLCSTIQEMAEAVFQEILKDLEEPYCLMGYSMGSLISYELYHVINKAGIRKPEGMLLFASDAPHVPRRKKMFHSMSREGMIKDLKELNGTVDSALENDELMDLVLPIARADFAALEVYEPTIRKEPITCSGLIMKGNNDTYCTKNLEEWRKYFSGDLEIKEGQGEHFFLFKDELEGYRIITKEIQKVSHRLDRYQGVI